MCMYTLVYIHISFRVIKGKDGGKTRLVTVKNGNLQYLKCTTSTEEVLRSEILTPKDDGVRGGEPSGRDEVAREEPGEWDQCPDGPQGAAHPVKTHRARVKIPDFQPPGETNTFVSKLPHL